MQNNNKTYIKYSQNLHFSDIKKLNKINTMQLANYLLRSNNYRFALTSYENTETKEKDYSIILTQGIDRKSIKLSEKAYKMINKLLFPLKKKQLLTEHELNGAYRLYKQAVSSSKNPVLTKFVKIEYIDHSKNNHRNISNNNQLINRRNLIQEFLLK